MRNFYGIWLITYHYPVVHLPKTHIIKFNNNWNPKYSVSGSMFSNASRWWNTRKYRSWLNWPVKQSFFNRDLRSWRIWERKWRAFPLMRIKWRWKRESTTLRPRRRKIGWRRKMPRNKYAFANQKWRACRRKSPRQIVQSHPVPPHRVPKKSSRIILLTILYMLYWVRADILLSGPICIFYVEEIWKGGKQLGGFKNRIHGKYECIPHHSFPSGFWYFIVCTGILVSILDYKRRISNDATLLYCLFCRYVFSLSWCVVAGPYSLVVF